VKNAFIPAESIRNFVTELENADRAYRRGAEKDDMPAARRGSLSAIAALVKLAEGVLTTAGVSERRQEELFESVRAYHHSGIDLNYRVQRTRLFQPVPVDSRPPTLDMPEIALRADVAAALHLKMQARIAKRKAAEEIKDALGIPAKSVIQWRRDAIEKRDVRLTGQFRMILDLMAENFPEAPNEAVEKLISMRKNGDVS
jgi:hypothetical protein